MQFKENIPLPEVFLISIVICSDIEFLSIGP
jgi:hypothetical protein